MKDKIIRLFNELLIEGYEFPPDCGREGRLKLVVLDEAEIDEVADKITGLISAEVEKNLREELIKYDKWIIQREGFQVNDVPSDEIVDEYLKSRE